MTPLASVEVTRNNAENEVLYRELERGIQSMKNGEVYTIEEAWKEIDEI